MVSHALHGKSPFGVMTAAVRRNTMGLSVFPPRNPPALRRPSSAATEWRALTLSLRKDAAKPRLSDDKARPLK